MANVQPPDKIEDAKLVALEFSSMYGRVGGFSGLVLGFVSVYRVRRRLKQYDTTTPNVPNQKVGILMWEFLWVDAFTCTSSPFVDRW